MTYNSDHRFVLVIFELKKSGHETREITYRNTKTVDMKTFRNNILRSLLLTIDMTNMNIDDTLKEVDNKHAPIITKTIKIKNRSPWYSYEIKCNREKNS